MIMSKLKKAVATLQANGVRCQLKDNCIRFGFWRKVSQADIVRYSQLTGLTLTQDYIDDEDGFNRYYLREAKLTQAQ